MRYRGWMIMVGLALPCGVHAQRGLNGGRPEMPGLNDVPPIEFKAKDLEKVNPASVLLSKAKDLKLDDSQRARLTEIAKRYDWNTNIFARTVDSLLKATRGEKPGAARGRGASAASRSPADSGRGSSAEQMMAARRQLAKTFVDIRAEFDTAAVRSIRELADPQRPKGTSLLDKPQHDLTELLRKTSGA